MKRVPFLYYIMACLLSICITACDKEEQLIEDEIPEMIKADLLSLIHISYVIHFAIIWGTSEADVFASGTRSRNSLLRKPVFSRRTNGV